MSLVRLILTRVAQLLVRLAAKLDKTIAVERVRMAPERFAVLRERYPDAPAHWIEAVARRTFEFESTTEVGQGEAPAAAHRKPGTNRADTFFRKSSSRARPRIDFVLPAAGDVAQAPAGLRQATRKAPRPRIIFSAILRVIRKPSLAMAIGSPGPAKHSYRPEYPAHVVFGKRRFETKPAPSAPEFQADPRSSQHPVRRRRTEPVWPQLTTAASSLESIDQTCAVTQYPEGRWPQWPEHVRPQGRNRLDWIGGRGPAPTRGPEFDERRNRWPDLPTELDSPNEVCVPAADGTVRIEQMVGTWSE